MSCRVCNGQGDYPIIDSFGSTLYHIRCPECAGSGLSDDEVEQRLREREDRARYDAAMSEMRQRP